MFLFAIPLQGQTGDIFGDFGDAPSNQTAGYKNGNPSVQAQFPTQPEVDSDHFIVHRNPLAGPYLGPTVSAEAEPLLVDQDFDDGWEVGSFLPCSTVQLQVEVTIPEETAATSVFLNMLFDWDHNGRWEGADACGATELQVLEWPIQNLALQLSPYNLSPGFQGMVTLPAFLTGPDSSELWVRLTISDTPIDTETFLPVIRGGVGWNGQGDFALGETEDYFICLVSQPPFFPNCPNLLSTTLPDPAIEVGTALNNLPLAFSQEHSIPAGTSIQVILEGFDPDGDSLSFNVIGQPAHGKLVGVGDNQTYVPEEGFTGTDTLVFEVNDGHGGSAIAVVRITMTSNEPPAPNAPPQSDSVATSSEEQTVITRVDTPVDFTLDGGSLLPGANLTFTIISFPEQGTITGSGQNFTYIPPPGFVGAETLVFKVVDEQGNVALGSITFVVVNRPPVANPQSHTLDEDTPIPLILTGSDEDKDPLTCFLKTPPSNGTAIVNEDCTASYSPDLNFNGNDSFEFLMDDAFGGTDVAIIALTINPINDPPVANDDLVVLTNEDIPTDIPVLDNDFDVDNDPLTVITVTTPSHGTASINLDGTIHYDPDPNYNGVDSFGYTICDPDNECDTATADIAVASINDVPVPSNDAKTTNEDTPVVVNVLSNDTDLDGNLVPSSVQVLTGPSNGGTSVNTTTGDITYSPNLDFNGTDTFTYEVCDDGSPLPSQCASATVTVTIDPVNDQPVLTVIPNQSVLENGTLTVNLSCSDIDGDALFFSVSNQPSGMLLNDNGNGTASLTYPPASTVVVHPSSSRDFSNISVVCGDTLLQDSNTFTTTVNDMNQPPVPLGDSRTTNEDTPITISVLGNDSDADAEDTITINSHAQGSNGSVSCTTTQCTYTPNLNFFGSDTFTYGICDDAPIPVTCNTTTVTVTVNPVNDPPIANDDSDSTTEDTPVTTGVLPNDTDVENDTLTVVGNTQGTNGSVSCTTPQCTYTPNLNFNGTDTYTYTLSDGNGGFDTATVTVTVAAVNDAPVGNDTVRSVSVNTALVPQQLSVTLPVSDVDTGDTLVCTASGIGPSNGAVVFGASCTVTYTPNQNFVGQDLFSYSVCDNGAPQLCDSGTVTVNVNNDAPSANPQTGTTPEDTPIGVTLTGSDPNGDSLTYTIFSQPSNGSVSCGGANGEICTYTPNPDFNGTDTFTFEVTDTRGDSDTAVVTLNVTPVNDAPVAVGESQTTPEDTPIAVVLDATDVDNDPLTYTITVAPTRGSVNCTGPNCTYTPTLNDNGPDQFTFNACDNGTPALCDTAVVALNITPVNDAPTFTVIPDQTIPENNTLTVNVTCSDVEGDVLTLTASNLPLSASFVDNGSGLGTLSYSPGFSLITHPTTTVLFSNASFTCSDSLLNDVELIDITVQDVNRLPTADNEAVSTNEDTPITTSVLIGDSDLDPEDVLTITGNTQGTNGSVSCTTTQCTYTPNLNFNGTDTYTYTISDGGGGTTSATVTVTVVAVNDPPIANNESGTTSEDTSILMPVLSNDSDLDGNLVPSTVVVMSAPTNGSTSINSLTGDITYTPNLNFNGTDTFTYQVCDDGTPLPSLCDIATVTVTVNPVNDQPVLTVIPDQTISEANTLGFTASCSDVDATPLSLSASNLPLGVGFVDNGNGTATFGYTPGFGVISHPPTAPALPQVFSGLQVVCSDGSLQHSDTFSITVNDTDRAPTGNAQTLTLNEDTFIPLVLSGNDLDGDTLTFSITVQPANGTLLCPSLPNCTFAPDLNFNGIDSFTFQVDDGFGGTSTAVVNIIINPVQDPPLALNDNVTTNEDVAITLNVLANDSDPDNDPLIISGFTQPSDGSVSCITGNCTYTPNPNFNGTDTFGYTITDSNGTFSNATVTVTIDPVNDAPTTGTADESVPEAYPTPTPVVTTLPVNDIDGDVLTCTILTGPVNGVLDQSVPFNCTQAVTYTPTQSFVGSNSYTYQVCDPSLVCVTGTVNLTVINFAPTANPQVLETEEDIVLPIELTGSDDNGDPLTYSLVSLSGPSNGTLSCPGLPSTTACSYTPNANYFGPDSFQFQVSDQNSATDTATVNITVNPVNDPPVASDTSAATTEDTPITITLPVSDVENDTLTCIVVAPHPANGTVVVNSDCTATYTPDTQFNGQDTFAYQVSDGNGGIDTAKVVITVGPVNDLPVLNAIANQTLGEGQAMSVSVSCSDVENPAPVLTSVNLPTGATLTDNGNGTGTVSYTPGFGVVTHGAAPPTTPVLFSNIQIICNDGTSQVVELFDITVNDNNQVPTATGQTVITNINTLINLTLVGADGDTDSFTCGLFSNGTNGTAVVNSNCTASYTPNTAFTGQDSFVFTVDDGFGGTVTATVTVFVDDPGSNTAPVANAQTLSTPKNTALSITLTGFDVDNDPLSFSIVTSPIQGTLSCAVFPNCTYTPNTGYVGADSFQFQVCDTGAPVLCNTATVSITVFNRAPNAGNDSSTTPEDTSVIITVLTNDSDPDGDSFTISGTPTTPNGTVVVNVDNTMTYTSNTNFFGTDTFTYTICDSDITTPLCDTATVTVSVTATNDPPVIAVISTQNAAENSTLSLSVSCTDIDTGAALLVLSATNLPASAVFVNHGSGLGTMEYTPTFSVIAHPATSSVINGVQITCSDGSLQDVETFNINVSDTNQVPEPNDQTLDVNEDTLLALTLSGGDFDGDALTLSIVVGSGPSNGALNCPSLPNCTYLPDANYFGTDSFQFQVDDGFGGIATGTVTLVVQPINDTPVANPQTVGPILEDATVPLAITLTGSDVDTADVLTFSITSAPSNGTLDCTLIPACTYLPALNFNGNDTFIFQVDDGNGQTNTAQITIQVTAVNDAPTGGNASGNTLQDTNVNILLPIDDIDGDTLTCTEVLPGATLGTVSFAGCVLTYTPTTNTTGTDVFDYKVCDPSTACVTATVTVNIVNRVPTANPQAAFTSEDSALPLTLTGSDPDNDTLSCTLNTNATNGSVIVNSDCTATYTPNLNYNGPDSFVFQVDDGHGGTDTATVTLTVQAINDAPALTALTNQTIAEGSTLNVAIVCTDVDTAAISLSLIPANLPPGVTFVSNGDGTGTISYTPPFTLITHPATPPALDQVFNNLQMTCNDGILQDVDNFNLTVTDTNRNPVAVPDTPSTDEDNSTTFNVLSGDSDPDNDAISVSSFNVTGTQGTATHLGSGNFSYDPGLAFQSLAVGESTTDSFTYTIGDGFGGTATIAVTVTVNGVNDAPTATPDTGSIDEDTLLNVPANGVLGNDTDPDTSDILTVSAFDAVSTQGATVNVSADGSYSYDPTNAVALQALIIGASIQDTFTYTANDSNGGTSTTTVTITVSGVNDVPIANTDTGSTDEGTLLNVPANGVLSNDTDADSTDILTVTAFDALSAQGATVIVNANGSYSYDPTVVAGFQNLAQGESIADTFNYTISDGKGGTASTTVTVTVNGTNDAPTANPDTGSTNEDTLLNVPASGVLGNDTDPDTSDILIVSAFDALSVQGATVNVSANGSYSYDPTNAVALQALIVGASVQDTFTYTANDSNGGTSTTTVTITVNGVNDVPIANPDTGSTDEDTLLTVPANGVLSNDTDADSTDILTVTAFDAVSAQGATVIVNANGSYSYDPTVVAGFQSLAVGESIADTFNYTISDGKGGTATTTVTVTVNGTNDAPTANPDTGSTNEDTLLNVPASGVLGNDTDPDTSDTLIVSAFDALSAQGAIVNVSANGSYSYDPTNAAALQTLAVGASIQDTFTYTANDGFGGISTTTVTITVTGVNDAPTLVVISNATIAEGNPLSVSISCSDVDGSTLTLTHSNAPTGTIFVDNGGGSGTLTYSPGFAVVAHPSASTTFANVQITCNDGLAPDVGTFNITVNDINQGPNVNNDAANTTVDTNVVITVLSNDTDADNDLLSVILTSNPTNGSVVINGDNTVTYTPNASFTGTDTFTYTVSDGFGGVATATVTVTVN